MKQSMRIELLDFARGIALIAMTIFHFAFDLELFGVQERGFTAQPHWKYFARSIATSFLFLAGFSLFLAHGKSIRWESWRWRMGKIVAAAVVITVATYFATPDQYIFFGILHAIAFASLVGLAFMRLPTLMLVLLAVIVFWVGMQYQTTLLSHWIWWWTGLSDARIVSSDFVPVFPWLSAPLLGIAAAKFATEHGLIERLQKPKLRGGVSSVIKFMGRNSLIYYLLHQPIMIAILLSFLYLSGNVPG
ncbi:MAG: heparan-alpha-glucosaminide N-acetyltransferase [Pseudomonadota bacterium]